MLKYVDCDDDPDLPPLRDLGFPEELVDLILERELQLPDRRMPGDFPVALNKVGGAAGAAET